MHMICCGPPNIWYIVIYQKIVYFGMIRLFQKASGDDNIVQPCGGFGILHVATEVTFSPPSAKATSLGVLIE